MRMRRDAMVLFEANWRDSLLPDAQCVSGTYLPHFYAIRSSWALIIRYITVTLPWSGPLLFPYP